MVDRHYEVLVVDDNTLSREHLLGILSTHKNLKVCADVSNYNDAHRLLKEYRYDLIFLDVQLNEDYTGFDLVKFIPSSTAIVFITGFDQYAIRAFDVNARDYIVKPIVPERIDLAIKRVMEKDTKRIVSEETEQADTFKESDSVWLDAGEKQAMLPFSEITAWVSQENYSDVYALDGECYTVRRSLKKWEEVLPMEMVIRVNRQLLVNVQHVKKVTRSMGKHKVYVESFSEPFELSRRNIKDAKKKYEALSL